MSFNSSELYSMFGEDQDIFQEIFHDFCASSDEMLAAVKESIINKNSVNLQISAHTLKGVLATFCALRSKDIAYKLEEMGRDESFEGAEDYYTELDKELKLLIIALQSFEFKGVA